MLRYLLDTNIVSEPLRPDPHPSIVRKLETWQPVCALPSVVWHELLYGCFRLPVSARRVRLEDYLFNVVATTLVLLDYDGVAAEWHARERARLAQIGKTPPFADGQIAAIAAVNRLTLVSFNVQDYATFEGLDVTDWRD